MGFFTGRSFGVGFAKGFQESLDAATKKQEEAEKARQEFLQKLEFELLKQIPEIQKNVFEGKADPAAGAAALQQLQTQGAALAPTVPSGSMIDSLVNMFTGAPAEETPAATDLSGLSELLRKSQAAGEASRVKETAAKLEFEKQKTQQASDITFERQKKLKGIKSADQTAKDTALKKNLDTLTKEFQNLGDDPRAARIKALDALAGSKAGVGVTQNDLFGMTFDPMKGGPYRLDDPESRAEGMIFYNKLVRDVGRQSLGARLVTPSPSSPVAGEATPKQTIEQFIVEKRQQGMTERDIARTIARSKLFVGSGLALKDFGLSLVQ